MLRRTFRWLILATMIVGMPNVSGAVISGQPVAGDNSSTWTSTVLFTNASGGICSSTVIGSRVILTAASCIESLQTGDLDDTKRNYAKIGDTLFELSCEQHPAYKADPSADFALCLATNSFTNSNIERINTDQKELSLGTKVTMVGYGCRLKGGIDRRLGELTTGDAIINKLPDQTTFHAIVTGAVACFGDSGGGTYLSTPKKRILVGVNSRSDLREQSWISLTSSQTFLEWTRWWAVAHGVGICGISDEAACHLETTPAAPTLPPSSSAALNAEKRLSILPDQSSTVGSKVQFNQLTKVAARAGETRNSIISRVCGQVDEDYLAQVEQFYNSRGLDFKAESKLELNQEIELLPCPKAGGKAPYKEVVVKSGDTTWNYYLSVLKEKRGGARWRDFRAPMEGPRGEYFLEAFREMNPGLNMDALVIGTKVRVPTNPASAQQAAAIIGRVPNAIQPIFALQSTKLYCKPGMDSAYPYNTSLLLDVLSTNRWRLDTRRRQPVRVLIADSGLFGAGLGVFRDFMLVRTNNLSWEQYLNDIQPLNLSAESCHGTQVASLVLGGPFFAKIQALGQPRVALVIERIYQKYAQGGQEWYGAADQIFEKIRQAIRQHQTEVVNLSIKTRNEILAIKEQLNPQSSALFISAAGNGDGLIGTAAETNCYPAQYGGAGVPNLLVVAAVDGDDNLVGGDDNPTERSNFSPEFVEIGAPGCLIPVFSYDSDVKSWKIENLSGTSVAAPIVSFAAALVRSEKVDGWTPTDLKRRLLVSADVHSNLLPFIADGRVLNVIKAVAIFQDVVELNNPSRLLLGKMTVSQNGKELRDEDRLELSCSNKQPRSVQMKDIFKLIPNFTNARKETVTKIYYRSTSPNALFTSEECDQPKDVTVLIKETERDIQEAYSLDEIKDIVRKVF